MSLLFPIFLGAGILASLPIFLHLLRRPPRTVVPFPTLRFLGREALRDSRRQRLSCWLLLLLRCLLIGLIALAFARPFWPLEHTDNSRAVVVVVDNSYSMQAAGRRAAVEAWLLPQVAGLRPPDELGVLVLQPYPAWLVPLGKDLDAGHNALRRLPDGFGTTRYYPSLDLAAAALSAAPTKRKQILLAGDEQRLGWDGVRFEQVLPAGVEFLTAPIAPLPSRQAAITAFRATRSNGRLALDATLRGFTPAVDKRTVTFYANERELGSQPCTVEAGKTQTVHAEFVVSDLNAAQAVRVTADPDDLAVDDTAYAVLAATGDKRVILADPIPGQEVDFLARAIASIHGAEPPAFQTYPLPKEGQAWPVSDVAVLRGTAPFREPYSRALDAFLSSGGSAWIICDGSPEQSAWLRKRGVIISSARFTDSDGLKLRDLAIDHPLFAPFANYSLAPLLAVKFSRGWELEDNDALALARWPDRAVAIAEVPTGAGRILVTGFGEQRADSDFPLQTGYVPFVNQAIAWLYENPAVTPDACRVGETLTLPGPGTWSPVHSPLNAAPVQTGGTVIPTAPGLYEWRLGNSHHFYAVNLDTTESDLSPWPTPSDFARLVSPEKPQPVANSLNRGKPAIIEGSIDERDAWWWLLVAAVVMIVLELACANRTVP